MFGAIAGLAGSALGAIGSIYSGNQAAEDAARLQSRNIAWEREQHQNRHQWEVSDLRKAGLNPILSANQGGAVTGAAQGSPGRPDAGQAAAAGMSAGSAIGNAKRQLDIQEGVAVSEKSAYDAKAELDREQARSENLRRTIGTYQEQLRAIGAGADLSSATADEKRSMILRINQEAENLKAELENIKKRGALIDEQVRTERTQQSSNTASARQASSNADRYDIMAENEAFRGKVLAFDAAVADLKRQGLDVATSEAPSIIDSANEYFFGSGNDFIPDPVHSAETFKNAETDYTVLKGQKYSGTGKVRPAVVKHPPSRKTY